jgi:hypothetical protein
MPSPSRNTSQTAYAYDARALPEKCSIKTGWATEIDGLLKQGYGFVGATFTTGGVLFRGMSSGVEAAIAAGVCGHFIDRSPQRQLEQQIGVFFCSQDLSDALTVARMWENPDSAIMVFASDLFRREWAAKQAAVMAFAEAGIIFRYPFLLRPFGLDELRLLIRSPRSRTAAVGCEQVVLPEAVCGDRGACESAVRALMDARGYTAAGVEYGVEYPSPC